MSTEHLEIFVRYILRYFERATNDEAVVGTPYLHDGTPLPYRYTGSISISGSMRGNVYYSANAELLRDVLLSWGEPVSNTADSSLLADIVGEIANTLAGNAREELGHQFIISTPTVYEAETDAINLPSKTANLAIPVRWKEHDSLVTLSFENSES